MCEKNFEKKFFSPFLLRKRGENIIFFNTYVFFSKMFFEKLKYFFSKKVKLTLCHHLGKALRALFYYIDK